MFGREASISDILNWLDRAITGLMTLSGFALDGMTRDAGWRFLSIGRRLERLTFTTLSLQVALQEGQQGAEQAANQEANPAGKSMRLGWLLRLTDSIVTYRSRYMSRPEWLPVLDLLVLDDANPRSVSFTAEGVRGYLQKLEATFGPCGGDLLVPHLENLASLDPAVDLHPQSARLLNLLDALRSTGFAVSERLSTRFFNLADAHNRAMLGS